MQRIDPAQYESIGEFRISDGENWLQKTGGIVSMPIPGAAGKLCKDHQILLLWLTQGHEIVVAQKPENGIMAKADQTVQRLNPGQTSLVTFYAYQWGIPLANTKFNLTPIIVDSGQPPQPDMPNTPTPATGTPADALSYPSELTTDDDGRYVIKIIGADPKNPRVYIDGQIYVIAFSLADPSQIMVGYRMDWINVLLFDHYRIPDTPIWKDVGPIWTQFGNLYPIMSKHIVDMNDRSAILRLKDLLLYAFSLPETDTMYMPVTRDLSENKRVTLVTWLKNSSVDDTFTQSELREMAVAASTSRQPEATISSVETAEMRVQKQLVRSKGGGFECDI